jgi:hypothetical protein
MCVFVIFCLFMFDCVCHGVNASLSVPVCNFMALVHVRTIPSEHRLSAKLVPTFADRRMSHSQHSRPPMDVISVF